MYGDKEPKINISEKVNENPIVCSAPVVCNNMTSTGADVQVIAIQPFHSVEWQGGLGLRNVDIKLRPSSFGICKTLQKPCQPMIAGNQWQDCRPNPINGMQTVTMNSFMFCTYGEGVITPKYDGQEVGDSEANKNSEELQRFIDTAMNQVGVVEIGVNSTVYNDWFYNDKVSGSNFPWCAVFVSWCANQAGILNTLVPKTASCEQMKKDYGDNYYLAGDYEPKAGDVFVHLNGNGYGHVGIVIAYDSENNKIYSVEGNTSDAVKLNERDYDNYFDGFGSNGGESYGTIPEKYAEADASTKDR